jgi:hypothetical protein
MVNNAFVNAFNGETNHYEVCIPGNNLVTIASQYSNATITIIPTDTNSAPPDEKAGPLIVKGTIMVSSALAAKGD